MAWDPYEWSDDVKVHAILMLLGWGFFVPVATLTSSHLQRRPWKLRVFGVHVHMLLGIVGLGLALAGFGYGVNKFSTLGASARDHVDSYNKAHAVIGCIATAGGILQVLLMALMRRPTSEDESYTTWPWWQKVGHFSHRSLGYVWLFLAFVALEMGTHIASVHVPGYEDLAEQNEKYSAALLGTLAATIVCVAGTVQVALCMLQPSQITHDDMYQQQPQEESMQTKEEP